MNDYIKLLAVMIYIFADIAQLLPNCYFGSRLANETDGITHAIYLSQWIYRNEKCKRANRILVERSMRPIQIYACGLFELSLPTFVRVSSINFNFFQCVCIEFRNLQICRAAYSYFHVLRRMEA